MADSISVNEFWEKYLNASDEKIELVMKHVVEPIIEVYKKTKMHVHGTTIPIPPEVRKEIIATIISSYFDSLIHYLQKQR